MGSLVLGVGALLVVAWLAGNLRSVERADEASVVMAQAVANGGRAGDLDRADQLFTRARRFGPDAHLRVNEAGILGLTAPRRAAPLLRGALREEPANVRGWVLAYGFSKGRRDPAGARARRRALALDPQAGPVLDRVDSAR